jgi:hypothetical protein
MTMRTAPTIIDRIRAEFLEMPGLRLTGPQVQRLCGIEQQVCRQVLDTLVEAKFLWRKPDGVYGRLTDGELPRPNPARASLSSGSRAAKAS